MGHPVFTPMVNWMYQFGGRPIENVHSAMSGKPPVRSEIALLNGVVDEFFSALHSAEASSRMQHDLKCPHRNKDAGHVDTCTCDFVGQLQRRLERVREEMRS